MGTNYGEHGNVYPYIDANVKINSYKGYTSVLC